MFKDWISLLRFVCFFFWEKNNIKNKSWKVWELVAPSTFLNLATEMEFCLYPAGSFHITTRETEVQGDELVWIVSPSISHQIDHFNLVPLGTVLHLQEKIPATRWKKTGRSFSSLPYGHISISGSSAFWSVRPKFCRLPDSYLFICLTHWEVLMALCLKISRAWPPSTFPQLPYWSTLRSSVLTRLFPPILVSTVCSQPSTQRSL